MAYVQTGTKDIVPNLTCVNMHTQRLKHADMPTFVQEPTAGFGMIFLANFLF